MRADQLRICVVTSPFSQAFVTPLSNLIQVLRPLCGEICVITAGVDDAMPAPAARRGIRLHSIRRKRARRTLARIVSYVSLQLRLSLLLVTLARRSSVCVFFMEAGAPLPMVTARLMGKKILWALPSSLADMARHRKEPLANVLVRLQTVSYSLSNRLIIYSETQVQQWHLARYRHKISLAYEHFLDLDEFRVRKPLQKRDSLVGYIGRLSEEKGTLNFLQAVRKLAETGCRATFMIGGDGQLRARAEEYAQQPDNRLKFVGWVPHEDLPCHLNELALLVVPSYTETGPYVAFEAMACGTPVLGTPVGLMADMITDGETGFIMENNSPECIAENIVRALNHPDLEQITRNARALVEREFTYEAAVERFRGVLQNLLHSR